MNKEIFSGKVLRLILEAKETHGKIREFEKVYLIGSVHVLPITEDGKIRLVKERRWDQGGLVREKVLSGFVENGETNLRTAQRELKEELGLVGKDWKEICVVEQKGTLNDRRTYYSVRDLIQEEADTDEDEEILGFRDYTIDELFQKVIKGEFGFSPTAVVITRLYNGGLSI